MENPASSNPQGAPDKTPVSLARVLKVVVPLAVVLLAGAWAISMYVPSAAKKELESNELERLLGKAVEEETLPAWTDQNQDLLADPPPADKCITPDTLRFSYVATQEAGDEANIWQGWLEALSEKTGVQTQYVHYDSVNDQLNAMKNGELHVTAVNTGAVPRAVKEAGFVPVSTFGKDGQFGYTMNLIVRDDSGLKTPADLRGHNITFVRPSSNSGFKAALVYLMTECDLLPGRDYTYRFSMSHDASVRAVADGETDAAPIASDLFDRMVARGDIDPAKFRVVYQSERFPPVALGYVYNLAPELRESITSSLTDYDWADTRLSEAYGASGADQFVPVDYKQDWAIIRQIDHAIENARARSAAPSAGGGGSP